MLAAAMALGSPVTAADAASHSATVKVTVIGRSGKSLTSTVDLVNVTTGKRYTVTAGKAKRVPNGTYVIGSYIAETGKLTLAARTIVVDRSTSLTFDARTGKRITASVDQAHARLTRVAADLRVHTSVGDVPLAEADTEVSGHPTVYAIPASGGRARLSLAMTLTDATVSPSPYRFDLARTTKGIPTSLNVTAKKADLARVDLDLHTPDPDLKRRVDLAPNPTDGAFAMEFGGGFGDAPGLLAPQHLSSYRSPQVNWRTTYTAAGHGRGAQVFEIAPASADLTQPVYRAGHTYAETWGSGAWGPSAPSLQFATMDGKLGALAFWPLCAPEAGGVHPDNCVSDDDSSFRLFRGPTQLAEGAEFEAAIPATPDWYDLQLDGTRPTGATTSTAYSARWHVLAGGSIDRTTLEQGLITLAAAGLNGHNAAGRSSTTRITMSVTGFDSTTSTDLAYSTDGTTWNSLAMTKSGGSWVADVPNPAGAGGVSLRANAAAASGSTVSETISNAYAID